MFVRRMLVIIAVVVIAAIGLQFLRSFGLINFLSNINSMETLEEPQKISIGSIKAEKYLILYDDNDENSILTLEQIKKTLDYMKKDYLAAECSQNIKNLKDFDCIFFSFERLDHCNDINVYLDYVKGGGSLIFAIRPLPDDTFHEIKDLLGIDSLHSETYTSKGIKVNSDIMFGVEGFETPNEAISNSSLYLATDKDCIMHLLSYDDNALLWSKEYGSGKFIIFNGTMLNQKMNRGLLCSILSIAKNDLVYPIVNVKMLHIDDFPAPIPSGSDEKIYSEYFRDIPQFYREIWWSDMIKLSKKYDLKYSGFVILDYNDDTKPPFEKASAEFKKTMLLYGKELLSSGGEIGLHGYNHQSLAPEGYIKQDLGYNSWDSIEDMTESQLELISFISSIFKNYELRAYVPPSNILSPMGRDAIKLANPDLAIIASLYQKNEHGDVYDQEFEIAEDGIIEFPRISSGYFKEDQSVWLIYNGIILYGIFSHFIHPDDVLDEKRSKFKKWSEMEEDFDSLIGDMVKRYGWLRMFTISSASLELVKYLECKPYIEYEQDRINIYTDNFRSGIYMILRTDKNISEAKGLEYERISKTAYLLHLNESFASIFF